MQEYLTVKEFAAAAGVSNKAIYQQLNGRLKPYSIVENEVKKISNEALELFYSDEGQKSVQGSSQGSSQVKSSLENNSRTEIEALKMLIEELKQDKEDLKKDKEALQKDKEQLNEQINYVKNEGIKWQTLYLEQKQKVELLESKELEAEGGEIIDIDESKEAAAAKKVQEAAAVDEVKEVAAEDTQQPQEYPQTFAAKLKWLFKNDK